MSVDAEIHEVYDEEGCARYESFVNFFFYPYGIADFVSRRISIEDNDRVLDAGCGFGVLSRAVHEKIARRALKGVEQHAFDISPDMIGAFRQMARETGLDGIDLRQLDVMDLPYSDSFFDLIVTAAMLEHVPDIEGALASLNRRLKPGGKMYVFMSRNTRVNNFLFRPFGDPKCYSPDELTEILASAGFRNIRRRRFPPSSFWLNAWGYIIEAQG
jgi:ubiquinone/menaquinone biosynthesis C-methylase UbiE